MMLQPGEHAALSSLRTFWPDPRLVIIGGSALRAQARLQRVTDDLDLVVALDFPDFPGPLVGHPEWTRHRTLPHRWTHSGDVRVDLLPVGDNALRSGHLDWPGGERMSVEAFHLLRDAALPMAAPDLRVHLAPVALVVLLKMISWMDRPERERDVADLVWLLDEHYLDERNDDDFDRLLLAQQPDFKQANALLLGRDIASYPGARDIAQRFILALRAHAYLYRKVRGESMDVDPLFNAFRDGLGLSLQK